MRQTAYLIEAGDEDLGMEADVAENGLGLMIIASRHPVRVGRPLITVTVPQPAPASRRVLWVQALGPVSDDVEGSLREVVHHFDLDPESIARVAASARGTARLRGEPVSRHDIWQACRAFGRRRLGGLADRIDADFDWDDIVLPAGARAQLEEIAAQVRHRATVYEDWRFARRLPRGRGVTVLFAGPSGTGKTMAAEVLARELDLDLYRIDLAGVVNKYIGETEKNLRRIFAAAEESGAILFFDEADALFGKRTDVRDSHDRYANIEVDYLLQRMEAYTRPRDPGNEPQVGARSGVPAAPPIPRRFPVPRGGPPAAHLAEGLAADRADRSARFRRSGAARPGRREHPERRHQCGIPRRGRRPGDHHGSSDPRGRA